MKLKDFVLTEKFFDAIIHNHILIVVWVVGIKFIINETGHHAGNRNIVYFYFEKFFDRKPVKLSRVNIRTADLQINSFFMHIIIKLQPFLFDFVFRYFTHRLKITGFTDLFYNLYPLLFFMLSFKGQNMLQKIIFYPHTYSFRNTNPIL